MRKEELCKEILLTPIRCDKGRNAIKRGKDGVILCGQKYYSAEDEDMSDISVLFYEIIYRYNLTKHNLESILNEDGYFRCPEFAGDTMNSFNTVANKTPGAGYKRSERTHFNHWPEYLKNFHERNHCLANFWLLPVEIGRTLNGSLNKATNPNNDYVDRFLNMVKTKVKFDDTERCYFRSFKNFDDFVDSHFVRGYLENGDIAMYSDNESPSEKIIEGMLKRIEQRAEDIANSKYLDELMELFAKLGLV